ncbi:hypothetical protein BDZ89DRAFT_1192342 [Hymenopellis radicata]|nr:hypothetical protein BDZ89DRAFT_1192342 [Hymenopellis radicata]
MNLYNLRSRDDALSVQDEFSRGGQDSRTRFQRETQRNKVLVVSPTQIRMWEMSQMRVRWLHEIVVDTREFVQRDFSPIAFIIRVSDAGVSIHRLDLNDNLLGAPGDFHIYEVQVDWMGRNPHNDRTIAIIGDPSFPDVKRHADGACIARINEWCQKGGYCSDKKWLACPACAKEQVVFIVDGEQDRLRVAQQLLEEKNNNQTLLPIKISLAKFNRESSTPGGEETFDVVIKKPLGKVLKRLLSVPVADNIFGVHLVDPMWIERAADVYLLVKRWRKRLEK